ncbi:MAG TPA: hypothetical protein DDZ53_01205 [Firmicutes bacterium]|nr:hypothetical protein [Bacillota bacterium]
MPTLLRFNSLNKYFGAKQVFADLAGEVNAPTIIGLVGDNGCGKSTLLRILAGQEKADTEEIFLSQQLQVAYLPQALPQFAEQVAYTYVRSGLTQLAKLEAELQRLEQAMPHGSATDVAQLVVRYGELLHEFERLGGYQMDALAERALRAVELPESLWQSPVSILSGGQKTRLSLARAVVVEPDLLLLDEPTNYLDLEGLAWLEQWVQKAGQAVILVSHDRYFLDRVATEIWELDRGELQAYVGNYSAYKAQKEQALEQQYAAYARDQAEKRRLRELISRQMQWFENAHKQAGQDDFLRAKAKKGAARAKATVSRMQRALDQTVAKPWEKDALGITFQVPEFSSQSLLGAQGLSFSYGEAPLLQSINFELRPGERVAIVGANGSGKTTLLRLLLGELTPIAGRLYSSPSLSIGHFSQERDDLDPDNSLLAELMATGIERSDAWLVLARLGFRDQEVLRPIKTLSLGQRARVSLAKLLVMPHNVLVLDEPTNHLDIRSREKIEEALQDYSGALILVSHDRYFLDASVNQVYYLQAGSLTRYLGNYSYFRRAQERDPRADERREQVTIVRTRLAALAARISELPPESPEYAALDTEYRVAANQLRLLFVNSESDVKA